MKTKFLVPLMLVIALILAGVMLFKPDKKVEMTIIDGFAQGTTYHIVIKSDRQLDLKPEMERLFTEVDNSVSLYNENSLLSRINRSQTDTIDQLIKDCIESADKISHESDGLYDVTIKPLTGAYGFAGGKPTKNANLDSLRAFVGYDKISINGSRIVKAHPSVQIDLNSIAQGATADYIAKYLESKGFTDYLVEIGGEIFCKGTNAKGEPWTVGIDRPTDGNFTPGADLQVKIGISGEGLATSGNYRKFYTDDSGRKIVHTINPKTGESVISNLLSATVVAPNSTLADAYGTMFMVMGLDKSIEFLGNHPELRAYLIYSDDKGALQTHVTPNLQSMIIP